MSDTKILVTGGRGFIGRHLVEALASEGGEVCVFDSTSVIDDSGHVDPCRHFVGRLEDRQALTSAADGCGLIFHLGGAVGTDFLLERPFQAVSANIVGTLNVLELARSTGARVVNVSLRPRWANSYMITKQAASRFCEMYGREFGVDVLTVRLPHVYGPGQHWGPAKKVVPNFIRSTLLSQSITIDGSGQQPLDLLYVSDAVLALRQSASSPMTNGELFDASSTCDVSLLELARHVGRVCEQAVSIQFGPRRKGEPPALADFPTAGTRQANEKIGFEPEVSLNQGLQRTVAWVREALAAEQGVAHV